MLRSLQGRQHNRRWRGPKDWPAMSAAEAKYSGRDASYMADNDDKRDSAGGKKTLTLKGGPSLGPRPGMSRTSRTVVVEKRTRRVGGPGAPGAHAPASPRSAQPSSPAGQQTRQGLRPAGGGARPQAGGLTSSENDARQRALREAAARQAEEQARAAAGSRTACGGAPRCRGRCRGGCRRGGRDCAQGTRGGPAAASRP